MHLSGPSNVRHLFFSGSYNFCFRLPSSLARPATAFNYFSLRDQAGIRGSLRINRIDRDAIAGSLAGVLLFAVRSQCARGFHLAASTYLAAYISLTGEPRHSAQSVLIGI